MSTVNRPTLPVEAQAPGSHAEDAALVRSILDGDEAAWERFVTRYAGLIHAMARRYLRSRDGDDAHTVFVEVLVALRRTKLRTYEGRAALSTWLTLVTRTEVMNHLRRNFGRSIRSRAMKRLEPQEQMLFRCYYIEGRTADDIVAALSTPEDRWTLERFRAALQHIERRLGDHWLRRLAYDLHAQSIGASSGRLLEYLDHVRDENQQRSGAFSPEYHMMEREAKRTVERLRDMVASLDPAERRMLEMRFERGWSASRIAEELGMDRPRGVYTVIERIVRGLRRAFGGDEEPDS
jgi:DNA-directed RNA polymerase specialized sigma24 family protein